LTWYVPEGRQLPWRNIDNPYAIWVSEIMLQQTQVKTVLPYYQRWLEQFPTVYDLAAADLQLVLKAWEGLGYYARARNLHRAAQQIVTSHHGQIPNDFDQLTALPGIGKTTAGGILSAAFNSPHAILDGNVKRVSGSSAVPSNAPGQSAESSLGCFRTTARSGESSGL
jgi:A/G-specific adenine glycosylase